MLIRVAVAGENGALSNKLANHLIAFSMQKRSVGEDEPVKTGANTDKRERKMDTTLEIWCVVYNVYFLINVPYNRERNGEDLRYDKLF